MRNWWRLLAGGNVNGGASKEEMELLEKLHGARVVPAAKIESNECFAEVWSWWHYKPEQVDPYWIKCTLTLPHDEHEDENTGLTWKGDA